MKRICLICFISALVAAGAFLYYCSARAGQKELPPEEQTLMVFLDDVSKGHGHWMNEQAMGQFPVRITVVYKGKAVLYEPVHVHQRTPSNYDFVRKLSPSFRLVPVPKKKVKIEFDPKVLEEFRKKK